jgi:hypothetical protein
MSWQYLTWLLLRGLATFAQNAVPLNIKIQSNSMLCLDLYGGDSRNGSPLQIWECNGHQSQLWLFASGKFMIQYAADPTKCLDAGGLQQGNKLMVWDCNGQDQQKFGYDKDADTIYLSSSNENAAYCLDSYSPVKQGNAIQIWGCNDAPQQQWSIQFGTSIRVDQDYKMCLDLAGGKDDDGTPLQIWPCNGLVAQQWVVDGGQIKYGANMAKCIDAYNPMRAGNSLQLWDCNNDPQQQWGVDVNEKTLYLSQSRAPSKNVSSDLSLDLQNSQPFAAFCLDLPGGSLTQGSKPDIWNCNQCWNQQWTVAISKDQSRFIRDDWEPSRVSEQKMHVRDNCPPVPGPQPGPGPQPSPSPPCNAVGGLPKFDNQAALQASPWAAYFTAVYGSVPSTEYPICLSDFHFLYASEITKANIQLPSTPKSCPSSKAQGELFENEIVYPKAFSGAYYILQPPPYAASKFADNTWVEVMHGVGRGVENDEKVGAWFYWLKGTGIWYNLGKSKVFNDHPDSWSYFKSKAGGGLTSDEACAKAAAAQGIDSVVYVAHSDIGTCPSCCKSIGFKYILVEILAAKLVEKVISHSVRLAEIF